MVDVLRDRRPDTPAGDAAAYRHVRYDELVTFEFLLPLTREGTLRRALDHLFYADAIDRRLSEIGVHRLAELVPRDSGLSDEAYLARITAMVADRFAGYSIDHVSGRYRAGVLLTRWEAADVAATEGRYLVDETTAVVRFIVRCASARADYEPHAGPLGQSFTALTDDARVREAVSAEIDLIRSLFFELFAEALVHMVEGEDEIWLLEIGPERRLYVWERAA